jgi:hypothetical protein
MYKYRQPKQTKKAETWKDKIQEYRDQSAKLSEKSFMMTPMEINTVGEWLADLKDRIYEVAIPGAVQEFNEAKQNYTMRDSMFKHAKEREIQRWDGVKLAGEMQVAEMRLKSILKSNLRNDEKKAQMEALFNEAKSSADITKLRAMAETLQSVTSDFQGDTLEKMVINRISQEAAKTLNNLRVTDEMIEAAEHRQLAADDLAAKRDQLDEVANFFHGGNAHAGWEKEFTKAAQGVEFGVDQGRVVVNVTDFPDS